MTGADVAGLILAGLTIFCGVTAILLGLRGWDR